VLWCGLIFAYSRGLIDINLEPNAEAVPADAGVEEVAANDKEPTKRKRRGGRRTGAGASKERRLTGNSTTGDDLGGPETRDLNAAQGGGEEQLLGSEIEKGFDSVFPQVKRCLMLAAGDEPVTGKIIFGLRIAGQGGVTRVNLQGPSAITQGEAGDCLRKAAQSIHYRSFNGPDMLVHYPLTLQ
jgi:hypothetical protein